MRRETEGESVKKISVSSSTKTGIIALVFMIIGFEAASFIGKLGAINAQSCQTISSDIPITSSSPESQHHRSETSIIRTGKPSRRYESFEFNPNTASLEDFQRLGFSEKQAQSILNYRQKGGHFNRKSDFAKSFVVSDSLFARLEPYINIPLVDINAADSAAFDALPGIGPYYASKMVEYRERLQGYSFKEQLMDIWNFDEAKYEGLKDLIEVGPSEGYALWSLPEDSLRLHPYIGDYGAHGVVVYRENTPPEEWSVSDLASAGILKEEDAAKLARCRLE